MKRLLVAFVALLFTGLVSAQSVAHCDYAAVFDTMPSAIQAQKDISELREYYAKELEEDQLKLQEAYQRYQVEGANLSPVLRQREEKRIQEMSAALDKKSQNYDADLQSFYQKKMAPLNELMNEAIENVAKANKIDYVLDKNSVLFAGGKDVTNLVIAEVLKLDVPKTTGTETAPATGGQ